MRRKVRTEVPAMQDNWKEYRKNFDKINGKCIDRLPIHADPLLPEEDRRKICGFIINKFRGDPALFADGYRQIEALSGWRGYGVVPWLRGTISYQAPERARGRSMDAFERSIDLLVSRLRQKLVNGGPQGANEPSMIRTVRGAGYMFNVQSVQGRMAWRA